MTQENGNKKGAAEATLVFGFFTEVGIISQLSTAMLASALPEGVHPSHFSILNHLARTGDGKTPAHIASAMQVTKTTMTHSLKVLSERKFIEVIPNPDDGRGKLVFTTALGRQFRQTAMKNTQEKFGDLLRQEHHEIMQSLLPDLQILRKFLDDNR